MRSFQRAKFLLLFAWLFVGFSGNGMLRELVLYTLICQIQARYVFRQGMNKLENSDPEGAAEDFLRARWLDPNDWAAYAHAVLTRPYLDQQETINYYTQVIQLNPHDTNAFNNRGNLRYELGDKQGALEDYTQAIQSNPDNAEAYYNRGHLSWELEDWQSAIEDLQTAAQLFLEQENIDWHQAALNQIRHLQQ